MLNPDPKKFITLPEAFDALGHSLFDEKWTEAELAARNLPPPKEAFHALKDAEIACAHSHQELFHKRQAKAIKAKKAASGVGGGGRISRRSRSHPPAPEALEQKRLAEVSRYAHLDPEIVKAASNQDTYRKEFKARARRNKTENELRRLLYGKPIATTLLNNCDGKLVNTPPAHWLADKFTVDFASGQAEWVSLEEKQRATYRGIILIDRREFERVVTNPQQSTAAAVRQCIKWARRLPDKPVWTKLNFVQTAVTDIEGLLKTQAKKVWDTEVPDKWKLPGRKS